MTKIGIHAPVQGATQRFKQTAEALDASAFLWLSAEGPQDAVPYPHALHVLRIHNWNRDEDARAYVESQRARIVAWRGTPNLVIQVGNEPDLEAGHDGERFPEIASVLRDVFPGIALANPPLSVEATARLRPECIAAADYVACHSYIDWLHPETAAMERFGQSYRLTLRAASGKPVIVTEVGVSNFDGVNWPGRNDLLSRWLTQADTDGIHAAMLYIADSLNTEWQFFDIGPEAAAAIRGGVVAPTPEPDRPSPQPEPAMTYGFAPVDESQYRGMVQGGSLPGMVSPFLAQYQIVTDAARQANLDVRALLAWTRSENHQATDISESLLVAHNAAGMKWVGQSRALYLTQEDDGRWYAANGQRAPLAPANEGSAPYCVFATWTDFWLTLADNINYVLGVAGGDLNRAAWYYTLGGLGLAHADAGERHVKARYYEQYARDYPAGNTQAPRRYRFVYPVDAPIIQGSDGTYSHAGSKPRSVFYALDFAPLPLFSPIRCVADGTVIYNGFNHPLEGQTGHTICVEHADGYESRYCHLSTYPVQVGEDVRQGQIIASSGAPDYPYDEANGFGHGAHLHFSISHNGHWVRCEELMAAGEMGPWEEQEEQPQEGTPVGDGFNRDEAMRLFYGTATAAQKKTKRFRWYEGQGMSEEYLALAAGTSDLLPGRVYVLGEPITDVEYDPGTPGRSVRYYRSGKLTANKEADGSYKITLN